MHRKLEVRVRNLGTFDRNQIRMEKMRPEVVSRGRGVYFEVLWSQGMGWEVTVSWYLGLWIIIVNDLDISVL